MIEVASQLVSVSDVLLIVGTSMQVYPAAGLMQLAPAHAKTFFVDPNPALNTSEQRGITVFAEKATTGVPKAIKEINRLSL